MRRPRGESTNETSSRSMTIARAAERSAALSSGASLVQSAKSSSPLTVTIATSPSMVVVGSRVASRTVRSYPGQRAANGIAPRDDA
jgi:hypothetical protein